MREASTDPQSVGIMGVFSSELWTGLAGIKSAEMSALCRVVSAPHRGKVHNRSGDSKNNQLVL